MSRTNFNGPKDVPAIEVRLYMQIVSNMKYQILLYGKNQENIMNLSSAELAQGVVKVKCISDLFQSYCISDAHFNVIFKLASKSVPASEASKSDSRHSRQYHPYKKEKERTEKKSRTPKWSFDMAYRSVLVLIIVVNIRHHELSYLYR